MNLSETAFPQQANILCQSTITSGHEVPIVVRFLDEHGKIDSSLTTTVTLSGGGAMIEKTNIRIVRGAGSVTSQIISDTDFELSIDGYDGFKQVQVDADQNFTQVSGTLSGNQTWTKSNKYQISSDLTIPQGTVLTIEAGTRVYLGNDVNIIVRGGMYLMGTESELISFSSSGSSAWGGIEYDSPQQIVNLNYSIFSNGAGDQSKIYGHSNSQPVLKVLSGTMTMDNCFFIDNEGKAIAVHNTISTISNSLISRCDTGAEFRYSTTKIDGLYSMFLPDEDENIRDNDNDGLYFFELIESNPQTIELNHVVIFGVEDDGIDFNDESKAILQHCFFGKVHDKGISASKDCDVEVYRSIFAHGDGQGIGLKDETEVFLENCTFYNNDIAIKCFSSAIGRGEGKLVMKNVIFSKSISETINKSSSGIITMDYSICDTETISGTENIKADPEFIDPENYLFGLLEGSPAIDSGDPNDAPDPDGTRRDIGAIPFDINSISPIILTEINYRPLINGVELLDKEFIEIQNYSEESFDLSNYKIGGDVRLTFPLNTVLPAGGFLIIAKNRTSFSQNISVVEWEDGYLGNENGTISLTNTEFEEVFSINYKNSSPWPSPANYHNYPIELIPDVKGFKNPSDWRLSYEYGGTPGKENVRSVVSGIVMNEFMARNGSFLENDHGEFPDWLELHNRGNSYVNLAGLYLSSDQGDKTEHAFSNEDLDELTLAPGGYLLLWADDKEERGFDHLNFTISGDRGEILLTQFFNGNFVNIDEVNYSEQSVDQSYGRIPNAWGNWGILDIPTPNAANLRPHDDVITGLFINEFVARYGSVYPDEFGNFSDWIEIYNSNAFEVNLAGLFISDDADEPEMCQFPATNLVATSVPPNGYLVLRADAKPELGPLHLNFQLASLGESIILTQNFNETMFTLDEVDFSAQETDVSYGRAPDGSNNWEFFATTTPGARNSGNSSFRLDALSYALKVFPNPAKDNITIDLDIPNSKEFRISVLNQKGQFVKVLPRIQKGISLTNSSMITANVNDLDNGIYYLLIEADDLMQYKKIVVLK